MENSFFEYRDKTGAGSDSDTEIIDNSLVAEDFYTPRKKPVVVAESEESSADGKALIYFVWIIFRFYFYHESFINSSAYILYVRVK